jgi:hypothetical protein
MYGNKSFHLDEAAVTDHSDGERRIVDVTLKSKRQGCKTPVSMHLAAADALLLGSMLVEHARALLQ